MPEDKPELFKILPDKDGNMPAREQVEPFTFIMKKPKAEPPAAVPDANITAKPSVDKPDQQSGENPRLHKALSEMVYNFLKAERPDKDADSDERKKLINAAVNVIKPVVLENSQDKPAILAEKITKELFLPTRGQEKKDTDAGLIAWEIRNANEGHDDKTISKGSKFLLIDGLADKLKTGIEEHLVIIRNAKINKNTESEREATPFEKEFKEMLVSVIEKAAQIKRGTEKSEIMAGNIVNFAAPLIKANSGLLKDPDAAGIFLAENLLDPKEKGKLDTVAGQVSYDLYYQAKKHAVVGSFAPEWVIKREVAKLIKAEIERIEEKNPGKLMAMINEENKQEKRDKAIVQLGSQLNDSGVTDRDRSSPLFQKALPPASGFVR